MRRLLNLVFVPLLSEQHITIVLEGVSFFRFNGTKLWLVA